MKRYYIHYYKDFANTFVLAYAESGEEIPEGYDRITRKEALRKARQADDFGTASIYPINYPEDSDILNDRRYKLVNRIWERV